MQHRAIRIATLLASGVALASAIAWVVGWFAAITITPETANTLRSSKVLAILYFNVAMIIAPVLALSVIAGFALRLATDAAANKIALVTALPWLAYTTLGLLFSPFPPEVSPLGRLSPLLFWQFWPTVLAAPLGLFVGARLSGGTGSSGARGNRSAA